MLLMWNPIVEFHDKSPIRAMMFTLCTERTYTPRMFGIVIHSYLRRTSKTICLSDTSKKFSREQDILHQNIPSACNSLLRACTPWFGTFGHSVQLEFSTTTLLVNTQCAAVVLRGKLNLVARV
eukprot:24592-Pelagococcus_subviridis.AAC.1